MSAEHTGTASASAPVTEAAVVVGSPPRTGALSRLPELPHSWRVWCAVALDVLIALGCAAFDARFRSAIGPGRQLYSPLPEGAYIWLAALAAALLVFRRRAPAAVAALVTGGLLLGTGSVLTIVVAYYSLARHTPRIREVFAVATAGMGVVLGVAALHVLHYAPHHGMSLADAMPPLAVAGVAAVALPVLAGLYPRCPRQPWWWEHRRAMLFDILLVLVFPLVNPTMLLGMAGSGEERLLLLPVPAVLVIVMAQGVALIWRRRIPTALAAASVACVPFVLPPLSTLTICLYTLAKYGRSRRDLGLICGAAVLTLTAWAMHADGLMASQVIPHTMFLVVSSVVVPVLLGMYLGAKRSLLLSLRERAERLEREQHLLATQVRMEERARIAREMHDVVSHRVSLMVVHAGALEAGAAGDNEVATTTGRLIGQMGRQALNELRQVLGVLRMDSDRAPAPSPPQPTLDDVAVLVDESRAAGVRISFDIVGEPSAVEVPVQSAIYRLVQEGLTNAHKHAGDAPVRVEVRYLPDAVRLVVENEAPSRPVATPLPSGGHGLVGLGERVTVLGGTFDAAPRPDGGFRITATIPTGAPASRQQ